MTGQGSFHSSSSDPHGADIVSRMISMRRGLSATVCAFLHASLGHRASVSPVSLDGGEEGGNSTLARLEIELGKRRKREDINTRWDGFKHLRSHGQALRWFGMSGMSYHERRDHVTRFNVQDGRFGVSLSSGSRRVDSDLVGVGGEPSLLDSVPEGFQVLQGNTVDAFPVL